jgi:hypothetical protein
MDCAQVVFRCVQVQLTASFSIVMNRVVLKGREATFEGNLMSQKMSRAGPLQKLVAFLANQGRAPTSGQRVGPFWKPFNIGQVYHEIVGHQLWFPDSYSHFAGFEPVAPGLMIVGVMISSYWLVGVSYFNTMFLDTPVDTDDKEVICCLDSRCIFGCSRQRRCDIYWRETERNLSRRDLD